MASPFIIQLLLLASSSFLRGARAQETENHTCIHMPIVHSTNKNVFSKRAVEVQLANRSDVAYYAQLNIGSPPQPVYVQLDTGSFELWVNPTCSVLDPSDQEFCNAVGFYDTTKSSTAVDMQINKTLNYGIGSANITYFKDSIALPGAQSAMTGVQFGVAMSSRSQFSGILGIGYGLGLTTRYPNFVDELAAQNQTRVKAYSVALGSKDEGEGVIVFGGVDTSKFAGRLATLPIVPAADSPDGVPRYWVSMNNMSITPPSGNRKMYPNSSMDVFLDTGSTLTLLPQVLCDALGTDFGSAGIDQSGFYPVDCSLADLDGTVDFDFNGVEIKVPYNEFIRSSSNSFGQESCVLGITPSESFTLLGDTFMRSAYAVFDLETNAIHMQQYANCGSTPAALASAADLTALEGKCSTPRTMVPGAGTGSPSESSPTGSPAGPTGSPASPTTGSGSGSGLPSGSDPASTGPPASAGASDSSSSSAGGSSTSAAGLRRCSPAALAVAMVVLLTLI
ncbi:eukaryotic aspartyl protease [Diaporthe helianthi]|uniref:Eukaryotic aspartyl protease n=1 Tax=Diaporthe helianthi TaxID=158607 RepID=A0A2P5I5Y0_DIAHE|nr:eukaryotic aspartyl protease [Diaporthe helianthi]